MKNPRQHEGLFTPTGETFRLREHSTTLDEPHEVGNPKCPACGVFHGWRDEARTEYPIICDLCGDGLIHAEDGYTEDTGEPTIFYLCDKCKEF